MSPKIEAQAQLRKACGMPSARSSGPGRKLILIGLGMILINRLSGMVLPASTRYLIDDVVGAGPAGTCSCRSWALLLLAAAVQAITSFLLTKLLSVEGPAPDR